MRVKKKKNFSVRPVKATDKEVGNQSRSKWTILHQEFGCQDLINLNSGKTVMSSKLETEEWHVDTKVSMLMHCHAFCTFSKLAKGQTQKHMPLPFPNI